MWLIYFSFGLILGIVIFKTYVKFSGEKCNARFGNEQTIFQLVEDSRDVIYHYDVKPGIKFRYISPSLDKVLGQGTIKEAFESPYAPFERIHPDDYDNLCAKINGKLDYSQILIQRWKDNEGNYRWFEEYITPIYENGEIIAVQGIMRSIDEKIKLQKDLEYRINHDSLTGIYNREYFEYIFTKFNEQINSSVAIILCDLDELKSTNDNFGHEKGDALIKATAGLLNQFSSNFITVARIGGDEFVLLVSEKIEKEIEQLVKSILRKIDIHNKGGSRETIQLSIGYALASNSMGQMTEIFSQADKNMYRNKIERKQLLSEVN
jgi:diguanylate cyclase (GGDEF)-like protein/PAS domain S-box-containing protein